jgi:hypothetical protein
VSARKYWYFLCLLAGNYHPEVRALLADTKKVHTDNISHHTCTISGETMAGETLVQEAEAGG